MTADEADRQLQESLGMMMQALSFMAPTSDTKEGRLLDDLAQACERYAGTDKSAILLERLEHKLTEEDFHKAFKHAFPSTKFSRAYYAYGRNVEAAVLRAWGRA